jgi:hypothetical protein
MAVLEFSLNGGEQLSAVSYQLSAFSGQSTRRRRNGVNKLRVEAGIWVEKRFLARKLPL